MKNISNMIKKFESKRLHTVTRWCGAMALLLAVGVFVGSGIPSKVYAWVITISPSYTPVYTGGNTTISWQTSNADSCTIYGPTHFAGETCYSYPIILEQGSCDAYGNCPAPVYQLDGNGNIVYSAPSCSFSMRGVNGSAYTGPINTPGTYTLYCHNVSGGIGSSEGHGSVSFNVYPTAPAATTLSFSASPTSVTSGTASTLNWTGTKGTFFSSCQLTGGQWGTTGAWFTTLPGSISTQPLTTTTTYSMNCVDTNGASTGWKSATVTVTPAVPGGDVCTNIAGTQTTPPTNGTTSGGVCSCNAGFTLQGAVCVAVPGGDVCTNIAGTQTTPPANGTTSGGVCSCNAGFTLQGATCVATPPPASCTGAHQLGTPPNCTCELGYAMQGGVCVQNVCAGQNEVNWPTCSCATGFTRDTVTSMCIRQAVLDIKVNGLDSTRVRKGNTVAVTWSATGVVAASCRVTTNSGTTIGSTDSGSASPVVANQTVYRLTCTNDAGSSVSKEASVNLIPEVNEQ